MACHVIQGGEEVVVIGGVVYLLYKSVRIALALNPSTSWTALIPVY